MPLDTDASSDPLRSGEYARKQLFGRGLIGWSHGRRFATARRVVQPYAGATLLDYGCGDGTFLALVHDIFPQSVGAEIDRVLVEGARERFGALDGLRFIHTDEVAALPDAGFGVVTCMEVLEHCTPDAAERVATVVLKAVVHPLLAYLIGRWLLHLADGRDDVVHDVRAVRPERGGGREHFHPAPPGERLTLSLLRQT